MGARLFESTAEGVTVKGAKLADRVAGKEGGPSLVETVVSLEWVMGEDDLDLFEEAEAMKVLLRRSRERESGDGKNGDELVMTRTWSPVRLAFVGEELRVDVADASILRKPRYRAIMGTPSLQFVLGFKVTREDVASLGGMLGSEIALEMAGLEGDLLEEVAA